MYWVFGISFMVSSFIPVPPVLNKYLSTEALHLLLFPTIKKMFGKDVLNWEDNDEEHIFIENETYFCSYLLKTISNSITIIFKYLLFL